MKNCKPGCLGCKIRDAMNRAQASLRSGDDKAFNEAQAKLRELDSKIIHSKVRELL